MTAKERLDQSAAALIDIVEKLIEDVPEPEAEEVEKNIRKILDYILDSELEQPIDKMKTDVIDSCLDILLPEEKEPGS